MAQHNQIHLFSSRLIWLHKRNNVDFHDLTWLHCEGISSNSTTDRYNSLLEKNIDLKAFKNFSKKIRKKCQKI